MANWNGLQLTNKGIELQAKVQAGEELVITKLKLGSGIVSGGTDIKTLNDLIEPEQNLGIGAKEAVDDYCKISSTITNTELEAGYYVRELGVFAQDPDVGEILYMYTTDGAPDYLPAGGGSTAISQEFSVMIAVNDTDNVSVVINDDALATMGYVQLQITEHNTDDDAHANMVGATSSAAGKRGMVPAPAQGKQNALLAGDGTFHDIATAEQAKAGTDDIHLMTPVKTKAAIEALVEGIAVGDVVYRPFLMEGYVKANGATVNRADYPNLVAYANSHSLWTSNPSSEPWKYGTGNGSTTMVLPDYRNRVIQGGDSTAVLAAGIPNISGSTRISTQSAALGCYWPEGVFYAKGNNNLGIPDANQTQPVSDLGFSAALSSNIYGASNTVQPPALQLIAQIKF